MESYPERLRAFAPFWGYWQLDGLIGEGSYGKVYRIRREDITQTYYSALKWIELPHSQQEILQLRSEGMTDPAISAYYDDFARQLGQEIDLMSQLRGHSHIVSFEDHILQKRTDIPGWDIIIRMELLTALTNRILEGMTAAEVLVMGRHICDALALLQQHHIIHRDIKPDNIFYAPSGNYKLGDFGVARQMDKTMGTYSKRGTPYYMAPEVYLGRKYDATVDTYSLGLVMYRLLNGQQMPFLAPTDRVPTQSERERAFERRMQGEALPPPAFGGKQLTDVILKACAYAPGKRFKSAAAFGEALAAVPVKELERQQVRAQPGASGQGSGGSGRSGSGTGKGAGKGTRKGKRRWWIPAACGAVAAALGITALLRMPREKIIPLAELTPAVVVYSAAPTELAAVTETPGQLVAAIVQETAAATAAVTAGPTERATEAVTATPRPAPTASPTPRPTEAPTPRPTEIPTPRLTATAVPTDAPALVVLSVAPAAVPTPKPTAAPIPRPTETTAPTPTLVPETNPTSASVVSAGDRFTFGSYHGEAIEWRVLAVEDGRALVISEYVLDARPYHETYMEITWEASTLRAWLNNEFPKWAFTEAERSCIVEVAVVNNDNPERGTGGGEDTVDSIFLLGLEEVTCYFSSDDDRTAKPTAYAEQQGVHVNADTGTCWWWFRSPGSLHFDDAYIYTSGKIGRVGSFVENRKVGVRPALWLNLQDDQLSAGRTQVGITDAPVPTATSTPAHVATQQDAPNRDLWKGMSGEDVHLLQRRLIEVGYLVDVADGDFGKKTEEAIERFQFYHDLPQDGIAGRETLNKLFSDDVVYAPLRVSPMPTRTARPSTDTSELAVKPELELVTEEAGTSVLYNGQMVMPSVWRDTENDLMMPLPELASGLGLQLVQWADAPVFELIYPTTEGVRPLTVTVSYVSREDGTLREVVFINNTDDTTLPYDTSVYVAPVLQGDKLYVPEDFLNWVMGFSLTGAEGIYSITNGFGPP